MTDHSAQVETMLADYRRSREQHGSVRHQLASVRETASSPDGLVTASAGPHGGLVDLFIAETAYQRYRPAELSALIVRTTSAAAGKAAEAASRVLQPVLPTGAEPAEFLPDRPQPATGHAGDEAAAEADDDLEGRSWLDGTPPRRPA